MAIFTPEAYTKTIASPSTMDSSYAMQATTELPFVTSADCFVLPAERFLLPAGCFVLPADCFVLPAERFLLPADCFSFLWHIAFRAAGA